MKPLLKWVGGKTQLLTELKQIITPDLLENQTYIEPFCGGAALCLDLQPKKVILNDLNTELINLYRVVSEKPNELIVELSSMQQKHSEDYYYEVRSWDRDPNFLKISTVKRAARFMYLNRTCFNGLYRVNSKGFMNAPIGRTSSGKVPNVIQEDLILTVSNYLSEHVDLYNCNYLDITKMAKSGDLVFLDPPYLNTFTSYQKEGFTLEDTKLLKQECDRLSSMHVHWLLTNDNNEIIKDLFKDYSIKEVSVKRAINCNGNERKGSEVLITNII